LTVGLATKAASGNSLFVTFSFTVSGSGDVVVSALTDNNRVLTMELKEDVETAGFDKFGEVRLYSLMKSAHDAKSVTFTLSQSFEGNAIIREYSGVDTPIVPFGTSKAINKIQQGVSPFNSPNVTSPLGTGMVLGFFGSTVTDQNFGAGTNFENLFVLPSAETGFQIGMEDQIVNGAAARQSSFTLAGSATVTVGARTLKQI
jgi:hypothetical protein